MKGWIVLRMIGARLKVFCGSLISPTSVLLVLAVVEKVQDHTFDALYRRNTSKRLSAGMNYECQYCGNRQVREYERACSVCGNPLEPFPEGGSPRPARQRHCK